FDVQRFDAAFAVTRNQMLDSSVNLAKANGEPLDAMGFDKAQEQKLEQGLKPMSPDAQAEFWKHPGGTAEENAKILHSPFPGQNAASASPKPSTGATALAPPHVPTTASLAPNTMANTPTQQASSSHDLDDRVKKPSAAQGWGNAHGDSTSTQRTDLTSQQVMVCGRSVQYSTSRSSIMQEFTGIWRGNWSNSGRLCAAVIVENIAP